MTTDAYISANKTNTFKRGDHVVMHDCYEATIEKNIGKVWTCQTDSYYLYPYQEVVFLEGFSGCFAVEYQIKFVSLRYK
jgi:hypothetical protein